MLSPTEVNLAERSKLKVNVWKKGSWRDFSNTTVGSDYCGVTSDVHRAHTQGQDQKTTGQEAPSQEARKPPWAQY